jgi:hypothetical protein
MTVTRHILITLLLLLVSTLASCGIFSPETEPTPTQSRFPTAPRPPVIPEFVTPQVNPTAAPVPSVPTSTTAPRADLGQTRIYRDDIAGFELDVPAHWSLTPVNSEGMVNSVIYTATFHSWVPLGGGSQGIPNGETKIDITVYKNSPETPAAALEMRKQEFANAGLSQKIISEETWTLDNNLTATRLVVESLQGEAVEIVTAVNGKTILISGAGDYSLVDSIARTLRTFPTS